MNVHVSLWLLIGLNTLQKCLCSSLEPTQPEVAPNFHIRRNSVQGTSSPFFPLNKSDILMLHSNGNAGRSILASIFNAKLGTKREQIGTAVSFRDIFAANTGGVPPPQNPPFLEALRILKGEKTPNWSSPAPITTVPKPKNFNCLNVHQAGLYADQDFGCGVFRLCDLDGGLTSFVCGEQQLFNQISLVCDWYYNVDCWRSAQFVDYSNPRLWHEDWPLFDDVTDTPFTPAPITTSTTPVRLCEKPFDACGVNDECCDGTDCRGQKYTSDGRGLCVTPVPGLCVPIANETVQIFCFIDSECCDGGICSPVPHGGFQSSRCVLLPTTPSTQSTSTIVPGCIPLATASSFVHCLEDQDCCDNGLCQAGFCRENSPTTTTTTTTASVANCTEPFHFCFSSSQCCDGTDCRGQDLYTEVYGDGRGICVTKMPGACVPLATKEVSQFCLEDKECCHGLCEGVPYSPGSSQRCILPGLDRKAGSGSARKRTQFVGKDRSNIYGKP
ncbi:hypothetical protein BV898_16422 [Hypsibius exemplaris]|uniref:Chitin-binding type-2 domain-containing protein n=1 Tax=Hypsibius exemplaris TaxID=2072580 RepID=A0A9X6RL90_HYPEX|nr:hypothetical protein BV898_16422 [Hypsibius exemplaris]